jgi:hypothetical protein
MSCELTRCDTSGKSSSLRRKFTNTEMLTEEAFTEFKRLLKEDGVDVPDSLAREMAAKTLTFVRTVLEPSNDNPNDDEVNLPNQ